MEEPSASPSRSAEIETSVNESETTTLFDSCNFNSQEVQTDSYMMTKKCKRLLNYVPGKFKLNAVIFCQK